MNNIRLLIVEDSILIQKMLIQLLSADSSIEIIGVAGNPLEARELIKQKNPSKYVICWADSTIDRNTTLRDIRENMICFKKE